MLSIDKIISEIEKDINWLGGAEVSKAAFQKRHTILMSKIRDYTLLLAESIGIPKNILACMMNLTETEFREMLKAAEAPRSLFYQVLSDDKLVRFVRFADQVPYERNSALGGYYKPSVNYLSLKYSLDSKTIRNKGDLTKQLSSFASLLLHERFHLLKTMGRIKRDIPYASAVQAIFHYFMQTYMYNGKHLVKTHDHRYEISENNGSIENIRKIIDTYASRYEEDKQSYEDGYSLGKSILDLANYNLFYAIYIVEELSLSRHENPSDDLFYAIQKCNFHRSEITTFTFGRMLGPSQIVSQFLADHSHISNPEAFQVTFSSYMNSVESYCLPLRQGFPRYLYFDFLQAHAKLLNPSDEAAIHNLLHEFYTDMLIIHQVRTNAGTIDELRNIVSAKDNFNSGESIFYQAKFKDMIRTLPDDFEKNRQTHYDFYGFRPGARD